MTSEFELACLSETFFDFDAASSWYDTCATSHLGIGLKPGSVPNSDPSGAASKLHSFNGDAYDAHVSAGAATTCMTGLMSQHAFQPKEPHMFGFGMPKNDLVQTSSLFASMPSEYSGLMDNWFEPATSTLLDGLAGCLQLVPPSASPSSDLLMSSFPTLAQNPEEEKLTWLSIQPSTSVPSIDLVSSSQPIVATPAPTYSTSHTIPAPMPGSSASPIMMPEPSSQRSCRASTRRMTKAAQRTFPSTDHRTPKSLNNGIGYDKNYTADCDYDDDCNSDDDSDYVLLENKKRKISAFQTASPKQRNKRTSTCKNVVNSPSPTPSSSSLSMLSETSPSSVAVRAGKRLSERILAASGSPPSLSSPSPSPTPSPQRTLAPLPKRKQAAAYKQGQRSRCPFEGCNKTFSRDTDVKRHIESVHDSRTLDDILRETRDGLRTCCRWCNKLLARSDACARHEQDACRKNFQSRWCQSRNVFAEGDKPTKKRRMAKGDVTGADTETAEMSPVPVPAAISTPVGGRKAPVTRGTRKSPRRP